jgi:hypothetical protein
VSDEAGVRIPTLHAGVTAAAVVTAARAVPAHTLFLCLLQRALVGSKLNSLRRRSRTKVTHSGLQPLLPPIEMHTRQLAKSRQLQTSVQTLTLADEGTTISSEVEDFLLTNLPHGFVDSFDTVRDVGDVLYGSIVSDSCVLHNTIPKANIDSDGFTEEPWTDKLEFTCKDTMSVDVAIEFKS